MGNNTALRYKAIEMGEGGQIASFLMTREEIAAEDDEMLGLSKIRKKSSVDDKQNEV